MKVLHAYLSEKEKEDFQREAQIIAALDHPNIVRILDFDVQQGVPFLVMDYLPNGTLRQRHQQGARLPLATVISYVQQVAAGLQYAHNQRLIHRDIKPENMLVGRNGEVVLSDFGIAAIAHSTSSMTKQGSVGTIPYMAPEQIQAQARTASDQYALGIVAYEWLTGERPFVGSYTEIFAKHLMTPPPPLRQKMQTLPEGVEQVILTTLAKDPQDRFSNVQAFAEALAMAGYGSTGLTSTVVAENVPSPPLPSTPTFSSPPLMIDNSSTTHTTPVAQSLPSTIATPPPVYTPSPFALVPPPAHVFPLGTVPKHNASRRAVLVGLAATGVFFAAGGAVWWLSQSAMHANQSISNTQQESLPETPVATATPTPTQPSPTVPPTLTPAQQAAQVIDRYYTAINKKDYRTAYNLWRIYPDSYQTFADGFADTAHDDYIINSLLQQSNGTVKVSITLVATSTSSQQKTYQGYYIVAQQPDGTGKITDASMSEM